MESKYEPDSEFLTYELFPKAIGDEPEGVVDEKNLPKTALSGKFEKQKET